ncbi:MAG TPA: AraC family transcriptional regulator [Leucothrix sp.]|nr:AraC family transcriptional regulator [Leucothrix sp.]
MNTLMQVQKGIDFIEANLDYDLSLQQIALETGISQWHFQRIFKALTNETLKTYIRSRRLANALEKLLTTDQKIIEIAITAGFESQESFTRAFKKAFELTPNEARKIGDKNLFLKKIEFNHEYLKHIHQSVSLEPEIYTQERLLLVGMKTQFYSIDSEKNNIANKLPALWNEFLPRMDEINHGIEGKAYGVIQQTKDSKDQLECHLEYYAVREVTTLNAIPSGMISLEIPKTTYAYFTHKGDIKSIDNTVNYIYSSWLLQSGKRHSYGADLEIYGDTYIPNSDDSIIHYAIPLKNQT